MIYVSGTPADLDRPFVLYDNVFLNGTLSEIGTSSGTTVNALTESTFDFWQIGTNPNHIVVEAAALTADCLMIAGHTLGSSGATCTLQRKVAGDFINMSPVIVISPTNNDPFAVIFPKQTTEGWRVRIADFDTPPQISVVLLGERLIIPGYVAAPYTPSWGAKRVELLGGVSRGGQFLGNRVKRLGATFQVGFNPLDEDWVSDDARAFIDHYNEGKPFAFASGPSDFPEDIAYCWRAGDELRPSFREDGPYMDFGLNVEAYVEP